MRCNGAESLSTFPSNVNPSRTLSTATPWEPRSPLTRIASPDWINVGSTRTPAGTRPTPDVLMKIPSPLPRSTTLVSPVTIGTSAAFAVSAMERTTRCSTSMLSPSSRIKPALRYSGLAPHMARSLIVPFTARLPMSPPGKNSGRTTYESVVKARVPFSTAQVAPS